MQRLPTSRRSAPSRRAGLLAALVVALLAACGDEPLPPPIPVALVEVSPSGLVLPIGSSQNLSATPRSASGQPLSGRQIQWSSNKEEVATVDGSGRLSAHAAGEATIKATSEGRSGSVQVTVRAPSPEPQLGSLSPGSTPASQSDFTLTIVGTGFAPDARVRLNGVTRPSTYVSATELRAHLTSVDVGIPGSFAVTVANLPPGGGISNALTFTVTPGPPPVASVQVSPGPTLALWEGAVRQFTATPRAADGAPLAGRAVVWSSTNPQVASVDASGKVTARAEGSATILATSEGRTGSSTVSVTAGEGFTLDSAAGAPLPAELYLTVFEDVDGVVHYLRTVVTGGSLRLGQSGYEQRLDLRAYLGESLVMTRVYTDRGSVEYDWSTGARVFRSTLYQNVEFREVPAPVPGALAVTQAVDGEGPAVTFVYRR